jgi:divalent metal cation (Fe/Co/Zn/Cd) transporter
MFLVVMAIIASKFKYYRVDALFGFVISLLIIFIGINILKDSFVHVEPIDSLYNDRL